MGKSNKTKLAVFDIDGTIFRSSLLIELINTLVDDNVFPQKARQEVEKDYLAWLNRKGSYEKYINKIVRIHVKYLKGCGKKDIDRSVKKVIQWQKDRVYVFTRNLAKKLKKEKYFLLAISGSPSYIVSKFASHMGFNASVSRIFEVKKGVFTGITVNAGALWNKSKVLNDFIRENGINADLKKSIAVGDTEGDILMLKNVGKPIAFNPNMNLAQYARKKGWKIVIERKDVIYDIKGLSFIRFRN